MKKIRKKIRLIIPSEIYDCHKKKIIGEILLNDFLENTKDKWMEFRWGRKRFWITRI